MTQTIGNRSGCYGRDTVHAVPDSNAERLLGTPIPNSSKISKQWEATCFKKTQEEARREQSWKAMTARDAGLGDAPPQDHCGHQDAGRDLNDQPGREGLPCELGYGGD